MVSGRFSYAVQLYAFLQYSFSMCLRDVSVDVIVSAIVQLSNLSVPIFRAFCFVRVDDDGLLVDSHRL